MYHLIKRVVIERQWAEGTEFGEYLGDPRRAIRHPQARLAVYQRRGGILAVTITPTERVVPRERLGPLALPNLLVIFSANRGMIVTGYQYSSIEAIGIPKEAQWLK